MNDKAILAQSVKLGFTSFIISYYIGALSTNKQVNRKKFVLFVEYCNVICFLKGLRKLTNEKKQVDLEREFSEY